MVSRVKMSSSSSSKEDMSERHLSIVEAAAQVGVSKFTVRTWVRQRRLGHFRLGRRIVISQGDLGRFLAAHHVEPRNGDGA